mmetsp:Transcript_28210/g.67752  ORF Transcript_28210/g.67752 Transcript_28210/m.67752 type:complete len:232 (+) Transcript_28210:30-725(+)
MASAPSGLARASSGLSKLLSGKFTRDLPIFFENPDGSMAEGVPPGYKDVTPPRSPRGRGELDLLLFGTAASGPGLFDDISDLYDRHSRMFGVLLVTQLVVEVMFNTLYLMHRSRAIAQVHMIYPGVPMDTLWKIFWAVIGCEFLYMVVHYTAGIVALGTRRPRHYKTYVNVAVVGLIGQALLAYGNKFNLLVFLLRLVSYMSGKFLRHIAQALLLVPANVGAEALAQAHSV